MAGRSLRPDEPAARRRDLGLTGTAIVAADKAVGIEYERKRPEPQRYAPWLERITAQLGTALDLLDEAARTQAFGATPAEAPAGIGAALAWGFCRFVIPDAVDAARWPALAAHAAACEATEAFRAWPIDRE